MTDNAEFWSRGLLAADYPIDPNYTLDTRFDLKCCVAYDFEKSVDAGLLRAAGVTYVLTVLPLLGTGVRQIRGPEGTFNLPRAADPISTTLQGYLNANFRLPGIRLYALNDSTKPVFAAKTVLSLPADLAHKDYYKYISKNFSQGSAFVSSDSELSAFQPDNEFSIVGFDFEQDEVKVQVKGGAGVVVVNANYSKYWHASSNSKSLTVLPVNLLYTAIVVPRGIKEFSLKYNRPTLRRLIGGFVSGLGSNK